MSRVLCSVVEPLTLPGEEPLTLGQHAALAWFAVASGAFMFTYGFAIPVFAGLAITGQLA